MPSFTIQNPGLLQMGPLVELFVGPAVDLVKALEAEGKPPPAPVKCVALVDTGASGSVITTAVAAALGLQPVGLISMSSATHQNIQTNVYDVSLVFPQGVTVENVRVSEASLGGQPIQCLIGRDVLRLGVLIYVGYMNQFTLSF